MRNIAADRTTTVAVIGLGYVGSVTAACLADLGHRVIGVDRDPHKTEQITRGHAPFYEPGLDELVQQTVAAGRLSATESMREALAEAEIALVCVGTPSERNGNLGLDQLRRVLREVAECLPARTRPLVVAIRSTVFPGTGEELWAECLGGRVGARLVSNPEFLREGCAVRDFMEPSLVVVGGEDEAAVRRVADLYAPLGAKPCLVSLRTAEMIKYSCNAFHALKITFANEMGTLASRLGVDANEVMQTLCRDTRLNISPAYLKPGFAFGGSCLPKDLRALTYRALRLDVSLPLLESILPSNAEHLERAIQVVLDLPAERIGIYGLAFKEDTDDLRESPVVALIEQLVGKGRAVRVFDPHIQLDQIYGSNRNFVFSAIPHIRKLMAQSLAEVMRWADYLVLTQKPPAAAWNVIRDNGIAVIDLAGAILERHAAAGTPALR